MNADKTEISASVYHLDVNSVNGSWIWDFGTFILYGSEDYPLRTSSNMDIFSAVANDIDASDISNREPDFTKDIKAYIGDYVIYVETRFENASHFISSDGDIYSLVDNNVDSSKINNGSINYIAVRSESRRDNKLGVIEEDKVRSNWTPVLETHG